VPFGAHAAVGENLGDGVLGRRALLALVGGAERLDVVERVIVADVLEGVGDALDEVFLLDSGHFRLSLVGGGGPPLRVLFSACGRCAPAQRQGLGHHSVDPDHGQRREEEDGMDDDLPLDRVLAHVLALMKVFRRWIDEMPMIAVDSLILSTPALTCDSHSGWSGWPSRSSRETKVS
jgi:hypothetical protein